MVATNEAFASRSIRRHLTAGLVASGLLIGGVGAWASTATLTGAVVSQGTFVVDSYVKSVQHLTGGVISEILVHDGEKVAAGDVLLRLDATQTRAQRAIVTKRLDELTKRQARLEAERDDQSQIEFPTSLLARADDALRSERQLFKFRRDSREGRKAQLRERIIQLEHEIEGLKAQEIAYDRGLDVLEREIAGLRPLFKQGVVNMQRLNALETQAATFGGERGEKIAFQAQAAGRIAETRLQILSIDQDLKAEVAKELREIQAQIGEFIERKVAAEDLLKRMDIVAPQDGIVHRLAVHTIGGVISPADIVVQIVPDRDALALEVKIPPQDIDQVALGQKAVLRMSAFNQRTTPELNGHVSRIDADLTYDERTGMSWYLVRITVPAGEFARLDGLTLMPGMPAEALIQTGERTALSYLVKPLTDQLNRAFREE